MEEEVERRWDGPVRLRGFPVRISSMQISLFLHFLFFFLPGLLFGPVLLDFFWLCEKSAVSSSDALVFRIPIFLLCERLVSTRAGCQ